MGTSIGKIREFKGLYNINQKGFMGLCLHFTQMDFQTAFDVRVFTNV